jgi:cytochrome oxidase assembly protein ShyY1
VTKEMRSRIVALTLALIVMLPVSIIAARWQWSRHLEREAMNSLIETNSNRQVTLAELGAVQLGSTDEYKQLTLQGQFIAGGQKLLRKQTLNGEPGFAVLTLFETDSQQKVLVNRGWIPGEGQQPVDSIDFAVPVGDQTIVGYVRQLSGDLSPDPSDLPAGQTNSVALAAQSSDFDFVVDQQSPEIANGPTPIPLPTIEAGPHLGYVGQWILIGIASITVYITVLRNLRREARQTAN